MAEGYRSGLEEKVAAQLSTLEVPAKYEQYKLNYEVPARTATYTPDFVLPNGIIIETKGRWVTEDRKKHRLIKACHPNLDIRFVFSNPNTKIGKQSKTTYAMFCEKLGFLFAKALIPREWVDEPACPKRLAANAAAFKK
ncbi:endodeoxyribonuclease [Bradyrhizobium aeschynomenes]|uniref:endodeoxyribonuclease n=1 Tax=Bradyrhizobium aeschynomenes TaxID=2734909 RepID=UPI001AEE56B9|nr:endodeoxyribonuclease [Bradyrhizobium aeschynomenes]